MSARDFATGVPSVTKKKQGRLFKRRGQFTKPEKEFIAQVVQDQPREMTTKQVNALSTVLRRSRAAVKEVVEQARENFVAQADRYVEVHREAVEQALASGDSEVAMKGSQWYLEHVSAEGTRIVDKGQSGPQGTKIMIGVALGGVGNAAPTITMPQVAITHD